MTILNLHGIFPALVTPYQDDESLDETALRRLVRRLLPHVDGFVVNGTTGDFVLLTHEERGRAIALVVDEVAGAKPVIAGTGAPSTWETIALTREALAAGATAALVVAPYYLRPTAAGLYRHFADLAAAVPELPLILYNLPQLVGQPIPPAIVAQLRATAPNLAGLKDTSGDLSYLLNLLAETGADFPVLVGWDAVVLPALAAGATGAILASANLIPHLWREVLAALDQGDLAAARAAQRRAHPLAALACRAGSLAIREGLALLGLPVGSPRRPLTAEGALSTDDRRLLQDALQAAATSLRLQQPTGES